MADNKTTEKELHSSTSSSWADQTDELDDSPKTVKVNAWSKGNPLVKNNSASPEDTRPTTNTYEHEYPPTGSSDVRKERESTNREPSYRSSPREDSREDYRREDRSHGNYREDRGNYRGYNKEQDYSRDRDYPRRNDNRGEYRGGAQGGDRRYPPPSRTERDPPRDTFSAFESREPREPRESREFRGPREAREMREPREPREMGEPREMREPREPREMREPREPREMRESREPREMREPREPRDPLPIPTSPPFTAFVGNLPYDIVDDDLFQFFGPSVIGVRLLINRETRRLKGFGYVEFKDQESLKQALERNGEMLLERPLKIDIASARPEERAPRQPAWSSGGSRDRFNKLSPPSSNKPADALPRSPSEEDNASAERRKLELKPRTDPAPLAEPAAAEVYKKSGKSNPFGDARPRDENLFLKKKEEERKQRVEQTKEPEVRATEVHETNTNSVDSFTKTKSESNNDAVAPSAKSPTAESAEIQSEDSTADRSRPPFKKRGPREDRPRRDWDNDRPRDSARPEDRQPRGAR